jgi:hypothetical protein
MIFCGFLLPPKRFLGPQVSRGCTADGLVREARQRGSGDDVAVVATWRLPALWRSRDGGVEGTNIW